VHGRRTTVRTGALAVLALAVLALVVAGTSFAAVSPVGSASAATHATDAGAPRIIVDTDLSRWWDDATALGMANVLAQRGAVRLLGVMSDVRNPVAAAALDAIDTYYGHASVPVGAVADSAADTAPHGYSDALADMLPHAIRSSAQAQPAVPLYRRLLAAQPDHSVTIVAIGGDTNLAGLLTSGPGDGGARPGRTLVETKVKRLVIEDGLFPSGGPPLTNEALDITATKTLVATWPTPIAWVDGFTGANTKVGAALCTTVPRRNPMRIVYTHLFDCGPPGDGDWDGPTMLYAVEGASGVFSELGHGGAAVVNAQGGLSWGSGAGHAAEVYVHVANQTELNARINALLQSS
jgi:pyrimidine-specific ribonucleoside hydrolase